MKKILFITGDQSRTGGTERICSALANMLIIEGYDVSILSLSGNISSYFPLSDKVSLGSLELDGITGVSLLLKAPLRLSRYLKNNNFDSVVVVESLLFLFITPYIWFSSKRPRIINWEHFNYDIDLGIKSRRIARKLAAKYADKNVVLTRADREKWKAHFKLPRTQLMQIYNLNPFDYFVNDSALNFEKSRVILAAGRLTHQKGFDLLIKAWSEIPDHVRGSWLLKIVGDGEDRVLLEQLIEEKRLFNSVLLPGKSDNMQQEYQDASLFVLSSRYEGFGLVLAESLTFGTPVISFDCPDGPSEIICHRKNGLLVPANDVNALAKSIASYISDDKLRHQLQSNTNFGLDRFSAKTIFPQWLELLEE